MFGLRDTHGFRSERIDTDFLPGLVGPLNGNLLNILVVMVGRSDAPARTGEGFNVCIHVIGKQAFGNTSIECYKAYASLASDLAKIELRPTLLCCVLAPSGAVD